MNRSEIEIKLKRIANRLFLIKQGKILYVIVVGKERYYEEMIIVPNRNSIRLH